MEYENISIIAGQDDIPDFKATIIVVVGQENYKPSWNKYQVHLLAMKQDFVAVSNKIQAKKHYIATSTYRGIVSHILEDRCKELSINLEELIRLNEPMRLSGNSKPKKIPGN